MISGISGTIAHKPKPTDGKYFLHVQTLMGVTYEVRVSPDVWDWEGDGEKITIAVYHHITEKDQNLFGFANYKERELFTVLLGVNGIGPDIAMRLMGLELFEVVRAILHGDAKKLTSIKGVGKVAAENLCLSATKKKLEAFAKAQGVQVGDDVEIDESISTEIEICLGALGYTAKEVEDALRYVASAGIDAQEATKAAIWYLSEG